jgi:MFS superfamily sulfate permease-like transporter
VRHLAPGSLLYSTIGGGAVFVLFGARKKRSGPTQGTASVTPDSVRCYRTTTLPRL